MRTRLLRTSVALDGVLDGLTETRAVSDLGAAVAASASTSLSITGLPPFLSDAAATLVEREVSQLLGPTARWLLRVTRPRLWFLAKMHNASQHLMQPQFKLQQLFELPAGDKKIPLEFLSRVNTLEWAV
jgi:hypothetical protein